MTMVLLIRVYISSRRSEEPSTLLAAARVPRRPWTAPTTFPGAGRGLIEGTWGGGAGYAVGVAPLALPCSVLRAGHSVTEILCGRVVELNGEFLRVAV